MKMKQNNTSETFDETRKAISTPLYENPYQEISAASKAI
jgi:hypothetical protein